MLSSLKEHRWKIGYFAAGILFIGLSRLFLPYWVRGVVLTAWAIGLAVMFARHLSQIKD